MGIHPADENDNAKYTPPPEVPPLFVQSSKWHGTKNRRSHGSDVELQPDDNAVAGPSELPPEFAPYNPRITVKKGGNIISHDRHLNEDGEALYRFLLSHTSTPPKLLIKIKATHRKETTVTRIREEDGRTVRDTQHTSTTVTDCSFFIDLTQYILPESEAPIWVVGDSDPAYRGSVVREVDNAILPTGADDKDEEAGKTTTESVAGRRKATTNEKRAASQRREAKYEAGLPPWVLITGGPRGAEAHLESEDARLQLQYATNGSSIFYDDSVLNPPTKTIRNWADEYCASKKKLKEFTFTKQVYGWNLDWLRWRVDGIVRANTPQYSGHSEVALTSSTEEVTVRKYTNPPTIRFVTSGTKVSVRPDNGLSRTLSKTWAHALLWIFPIYPLIIWPFKRFSRWGGGEWRVSGCAFTFTKWIHMEDSFSGETVEDFMERHGIAYPENIRGVYQAPILRTTPRGISQLVGLRDGEWIELWHKAIADMVRHRRIARNPVQTPGEADIGATHGWRGWVGLES